MSSTASPVPLSRVSCNPHKPTLRCCSCPVSSASVWRSFCCASSSLTVLPDPSSCSVRTFKLPIRVALCTSVTLSLCCGIMWIGLQKCQPQPRTCHWSNAHQHTRQLCVQGIRTCPQLCGCADQRSLLAAVGIPALTLVRALCYRRSSTDLMVGSGGYMWYVSQFQPGETL